MCVGVVEGLVNRRGWERMRELFRGRVALKKDRDVSPSSSSSLSTTISVVESAYPIPDWGKILHSLTPSKNQVRPWASMVIESPRS